MCPTSLRYLQHEPLHLTNPYTLYVAFYEATQLAYD
jgi:hypothetical protein